MRRSDREVSDPRDIEEIIASAMVCRLGLVDGDRPYIVPVCFGYEDGHLYVHCAPVGHKIDLLTANPEVCVELEADVELIRCDQACGWAFHYRSAIGYGRGSVITDEEQKEHCLDVIMAHCSSAATDGEQREHRPDMVMAHYDSPGTHEYKQASLRKMVVIDVAMESWTAKRSGN